MDSVSDTGGFFCWGNVLRRHWWGLGWIGMDWTLEIVLLGNVLHRYWCQQNFGLLGIRRALGRMFET